ncbi:hypothetical protein AOQ84DRAFT_205433 [Glonium stellatum]|uniref:Zn(2)-C6 fungal-type domain-containing protein n=1 Tax=Glonium stellatum TaxID=574774 RepID=A0A8E2JV91_9PEZI|nr:hypothetical protein AOQ84DRAFT_205433 [Glonium stellatum]
MEAFTADMELESIETPVPRPSTSRRNTDRPPKLRSSCDICANAKVKCDRERPVCQRCQNSGMRCNYSISRRMGKPPASARKDGATSGGKQQSCKSSPRQSSGMLTPERDSHKPFLDDRLGGSSIPNHLGPDNSLLDFDHTSSLPWHDLNFMSEACGDPNNYTFNETLLSTSALLALEGSISFSDSWGSMDHSNDLTRVNSRSSDQFKGPELDVSPSFDIHSGVPCTSAFQYPAEPLTLQTTPERRHPPHSARSTSCSNLASSTLQSLHIPSNFCTTFSPTSGPNTDNQAPPSSIDQVLAANRRAIATFHQLLQCPCSSNSGLVLALALIILKILSCYTAIGRSTSSRTISTRSASSETSGASSPWGFDTNMEREVMLDIPITMGAYQIDAEDEHHLKLQLVLNELRKVSKLIDAFAGRYCRGGNGGEGIHSALEKFLRAELRTASKEVSTALRVSEDGAVA